MNALPEFTEAQADYLIRFLNAPERPEGTFTYEELSGFLFAMSCVPEVIAPDEWLPFVFDDEEPNFQDQTEAEACISALFALHNRIHTEIVEGTPTLPPRCVPSADPAANFGPEASLGRWCHGFGAGYDWLEEAWPEELPEEADEHLGAALVTLTFFESREMAQVYINDIGGEPRPLDAWAKDMLETFPEMMSAYAELAEAVMTEGE